MRDTVLIGPEPGEIEALQAIAEGRRPNLAVALRLRAKGWIDLFEGAYLLTIPGRALVDRYIKSAA